MSSHSNHFEIDSNNFEMFAQKFFFLNISLFFSDGVRPETKALLTATSKKKTKAGKGDPAKDDESYKVDSVQPVHITLLFKRYIFDPQKKMIQSWGASEVSL